MSDLGLMDLSNVKEEAEEVKAEVKKINDNLEEIKDILRNMDKK